MVTQKLKSAEHDACKSNAINVGCEAKMDLPNFTVFSCIGKACGGFANVYLARRHDGHAMAIRVCPLEMQEIQYHTLLEEIAVMRRLRHANILHWDDVFLHGKYLCLTAPLMDYGSVTDLIHARFMFGLPEAVIVLVLHDVLKAIQYIHNKDFIHRGIRCSHILISSEGRAYLAGFRNAVCVVDNGKRLHVMHEFSPTFKSNLLWLAPELLQQNLSGYGTKSDIYSFGIAACEMANGFPPFSDMAHMQMLLEKLRGTTPRLLDVTTLGGDDFLKSDGIDVSSPDHSGVIGEQKERRFSNHFHHLTELCLKTNTVERPSAAELLNHPFFRQVKKQRPALRELLYPVKPLMLPDEPDGAHSSKGRFSPTLLDTGAFSSASAIDWHFD